MGGLAPDVETLLRGHGIRASENPVEHNGFSGASISRIEQDGTTYWLKRVSLAGDWIMRGLADTTCREAEFAVSPVARELPASLRIPYLGAARDGDGWAILSRDVSASLFASDGVETAEAWDAILGALAEMHAMFWRRRLDDAGVGWCPWRERLVLLSPERAWAMASEGIDFGVPDGWRAFERVAPPRAREVILGLLREPGPLLRAMAELPSTLLHLDAKIANMGLDGSTVWMFDWADVAVAPVGLEVGYLLAVNSSRLPWKHDETLARYTAHLEQLLGTAGFAEADWRRQAAVAVLSGFMTLAWAKAGEAERGTREEFDWWCTETVKAADLLGL